MLEFIVGYLRMHQDMGYCGNTTGITLDLLLFLDTYNVLVPLALFKLQNF